MISEIDVRDILQAVHVPTLVLHRGGNRWIRAQHGRYLAEHIEGARYVELSGDNHYAFYGDLEAVVDEMRSFLATLPEPHDVGRMLAAILVTDIAGSTRRAAELGDSRWRALLDEHDAITRKQLAAFRGREIRSTGDGFLAVFDGAARAVRCAGAIRDALRPLDLRIRAGVHSGEIESRGGGVDGIAIHVATRVAETAAPGEVIVSQTVKDLTLGGGLVFDDRGVHPLKGVPGEWRMFAVET
jgi:class 3 adenylate cyclase